jgi:hypothetical protein
MCFECWVEDGKPAHITESVLKAAPMIRETSELGALSRVVKWNLEDDDLKDDDVSLTDEDAPMSYMDEDALTPNERALRDLLLEMPYDDRVSAMALANGFIDENGIELASSQRNRLSTHTS